jgi:hypothetical protein
MGKPACPSNLGKLTAGPRSVTFKNPSNTLAAADLWSGLLAYPAALIWLSSSGPGEPSLDNSLYFHFTKIGNIYTTAGGLIIPNGNECWLPIKETGYATSAVDRNGWYIKFRPGHECTDFYIDFGNESQQAGNQVTFGYSNDIDEIVWPNRVGGAGAF